MKRPRSRTWQTEVNVAADLSWYFGGEAVAALGHRSPLGTQLDMLAAGILGGRKVALSDDAMSQRQIEAAERVSEISGKLRRVTEHQHRVLELQFGSAESLGDVSLALATESPTATAYFAAVQVRPKATTRKSKNRVRAESTVREWVLWLAAKSDDKDGADKKAILATILHEARLDLAVALQAYQSADKEIGHGRRV